MPDEQDDQRLEDDDFQVVDLSWSPEKIKEFCETHGNWMLTLDRAMSPGDVEALYRRQLAVPEPYDGVISEIAAHLHTPQWVLEDIATRFAASADVMGSLATNPSVPDALLRRLAEHEHPIVREHAEQTLRRR